MNGPSSFDVTETLNAATRGDDRAIDELFAVVYNDLRDRAKQYVRGERKGHTLQPTALVHEAYLRLVDVDRIDWQGEAHFFAVAATTMRRVLIDHAKSKGRHKRGGGRDRVFMGDSIVEMLDRTEDLLAIDEALQKLAVQDPAQVRIVELRFFLGLTMERVSELMGVSLRTANREWAVAKAWLHGELGA